MNMTAIYALVAFAGLAFGYVACNALYSPYKRMRIKRRIRCFFGRHDAGPVRDVVGGRRQQRCDWCDKVVREYEVTVNEAKTARIRRIY